MASSGIDYRDCITGEDESAFFCGAKNIPGPYDREMKQSPPPMAAPDKPDVPIEKQS